MGTTSASKKIIYVAWIEDSGKSFVQYLYTCQNLFDVSNIVSKQTCPYWRTGVHDAGLDNGIDVMSGATKNYQNFSKTITLPTGSPTQFTVYFEVDRSWDPNGWWSDQPAVLYAVDVDLSGVTTTKTFTLSAQGWTRNVHDGTDDNMGDNENVISGNPLDSAVGALQTEMRYITNAPNTDGSDFGDEYAADSTEDATNMVGALTLTATKK